MSYGSVDGFFARYPQTKITSSDVSQVFLPDASAWLDSALAGAFTVPFSANNATVVTLAYLKALHLIKIRTQNPTDAQEAGREIADWIARLKAGQAALLTTSADLQFARSQDAPPEQQVSSTMGAYQPVFTMDDPLQQQVDPNLIADLRRARAYGLAGSRC
jgi:phage gp36-like protein